MLISNIFLPSQDTINRLAACQMPPCCRLMATILTALGLLLMLPAVTVAQQNQFDNCLLELLRQPDNDHLTSLELKQRCASGSRSGDTAAAAPLENGREYRQGDADNRSEQARFNAFFEPYKETYFLAGSMNGDDGYQPFSGQTADIKFSLGLKFRLFPDLPAFEKLAPLYFGYAQESWWDIAESSAPFREHNYNPEIFWDYSKTSNRNGFNFIGQFIDQLGFEHQSNGRDGTASRSWDRLYLQRQFQVSGRLDLGIKAWKDVNNGDFNKDITDYLGNFKLSASYRVNDRMVMNVDAQQGWDTSKLSYQLDFIYRIPEWVNGQFVLSYYEGYGEALVSYNQKTSSLRAGLFFPISFDGN
jgi:phospholipase A1